MPEQPNLTHVATTLKFCVEQLELCFVETDKIHTGENAGVAMTVRTLTGHAITYVNTALNRLAMSGIEPAHVEPEGAVPA